MGDDERLNLLIRKRGTIKGRITKLNQYYQSIKDIEHDEFTSVQIKELEKRVEKCNLEISREFDTIQSEIEEFCSDDKETEKQLNEREAIEADIIHISSSMQDLLETLLKIHKDDSSQASSHSSQTTARSARGGLKLPTIKLPSFDGSYLKWLEFRDTFQSLIGSSGTIPEINKFHYLRSSLEGGAMEVIKSLEFTAANFKVAWELLCSRYDNKKILINNHLKQLFEIEKINVQSHKALRSLVDEISKNLRALNTLGQPTTKWDSLVIFMVASKLDSTTNMKWEEHRNNLSQIPTLEQFYSFIRGRADILESTQSTSIVHSVNNYAKNEKSNKWKGELRKSNSFVSSTENLSEFVCPFCTLQGHRVHDCKKFKNLEVTDRVKEVDRLKLCSNCLRQGHKSITCTYKAFCGRCKKKHNSLVCMKSKKSAETNTSVNTATSCITETSSNPPVALSAAVSNNQVLLCTALVQVVNAKTNQACHVRALLDTGSQSSFVTSSLRDRLALASKCAQPISISGVNNLTFNISERCTLHLKSRTGSYNTDVKCLVVPQITGILPSAPVNVKELNLPINIELADPSFYRPSTVDILLGADVYWSLVGSKRIKLGLGKPILLESELGWLVGGPLGECASPSHVTCNFTKQIHENLQRFWEVDDLPSNNNIKLFTPEEKICEDHYLENLKRLENGRFLVKIPLKMPEDTLGNSYNLAKNRFLNLEKKFTKNPKLKREYSAFINEYKNMGHLSEIERPKFRYFLPHHAVLREKSETTKLRVVFDASAKTTSGKSFNDIQYVGPVVQDDLISILLRFRTFKYVITGDIQKMYRQIEVDEQQHHLQMILWRDDESQPIRVLQLNTVTYGTASAPFLATRCLLQLARECPDPIISNILEHDIYMDDVSTGCQSENDVKFIYDGVKNALSSACFPLHKIRTNCPKVLEVESTSETLDLCKQSSVLGLHWSPSPDILHFCADLDNSKKITKRTIISLTCKVFDPLGLLCACIITAKILLQKLWSLKLGWDELVPQDLALQWTKIAENISELSKITLARNVICDNPSSVELHCFVDASQDAYSSCIYIRSTDDKGCVSVRLLCAKARVSPLKAMTIPRLELCGALLGAQLSEKVLKSVRCDISHKFMWTDSTIVLGWVKAQPKLLKTFVANRITEIQGLTQGFSWRHVPTDLNPADLASRGVTPQRLQVEPLWWEGPSFLRKDQAECPQNHTNMSFELPELKVHIHVHKNESEESLLDFSKYSSFTRLKRIVAYVLRFVNNCRSEHKLKDSLQNNELSKSLTVLIKLTQQQSFTEEIKILNSNDKQLNKNSKLLGLNPFKDSDGILRVGGRMKNSTFCYNKKHPIILNSNHHFTKMLMRHEHNRLFHAGPQLLLSSIREEYWPIGGRNLARAVAKKCVVCARYRGRTINPIMGNLPKVRTEPSFPFHSTGTDFAGPFSLSSKKGRGNRISKCYLCLFVCLTTRAVHLEVVSDLSTQAFILCLRRFVSRRGKPQVIYCDNGTNFVGANNELSRMLRSSYQSVNDFANAESIRFKFSPAYSPHFGGIWEAGVKAAKFHLKTVAGNASFTFEELTTLFAQVESILNSRPLSPLSSDPFDLNPLTPGHFLIGRPLMSVPSFDVEDSKPDYQLIEKVRREFWNRCIKEFLAEMQQRSKWKRVTPEPSVGDMVIIKDGNLPPQRWRLGRISKLHPGTDDTCRVVDVYTAKGTIRRAIHNVVRLPVEGEEDVEN